MFCCFKYRVHPDQPPANNGAAQAQEAAPITSPLSERIETIQPTPVISDQYTSMRISYTQGMDYFKKIEETPEDQTPVFTAAEMQLESRLNAAITKLNTRLYDLNHDAIGEGSCFGWGNTPSQNIEKMTSEELQGYFSECEVEPKLLVELFQCIKKSSIEEELFIAALEKAHPGATKRVKTPMVSEA